MFAVVPQHDKVALSSMEVTLSSEIMWLVSLVLCVFYEGIES